ncbi:MAG: hypothetical protein LBC35_05065 [Coriobacteriales bacterium]|jgi:uncharacterized membrane protein|nr:hypothetical protein [Coriobacteriales bacterium]
MRGRTYLLVAGILLVISGCVGLLMGIVAQVLMAQIAAGLSSSQSQAPMGLDMLTMAILVISAAITIVIGVLGIIWRERPDKTTPLKVIGIVLIALAVLGLIFSPPASLIALISPLATIALGVVYVVGAYLNERS